MVRPLLLMSSFSGLMLLSSCGGAPSEPTQRTTPASVGVGGAPGAPEDRRSLAPEATFADLVDRARALAEMEGAAASDPPCLLRIAGEPRLGAEVLIGVSPLPQPALDLDAALSESRGPVRVLAAYAPPAAADASLAIAPFTATTPRASATAALILFLTDRGLHLRRSDEAMPDDEAAPFLPNDVAAHLASRSSASFGAVYVVAEAGIGMDTLGSLLRALSLADGADGRDHAFAVALDAEARIPPPPAAAATSAARCPEGIAVPEGVEYGELDPAAAREVLLSLRPRLTACVDASTELFSEVALYVVLRVGEDGGVREVCVGRGEGPPIVEACVLEVVQSARFARPSPAGVVDLALPLRLAQGRAAHPRPLCP